jgi:endonuclease-3 related protein
VARVADLPDDPGLRPTALRAASGPYVGTPSAPIARFAVEPRLDALVRELYAGFGPQHWWPAETPFEVVVGAVLTQNTTWRNVERALAGLRAPRRLTPARILELDEEELAELVRPSGTFRAKARKLRAVAGWYLDAGGLRALRERPLEPLREELLGVFGVGPETADGILCYAAGRRTPVVDAYTRRILGRHGLLPADAPYEEVRGRLRGLLVDDQLVYEEFHALCVRAGAAHCKPKPDCESCPAAAPDAPDG